MRRKAYFIWKEDRERGGKIEEGRKAERQRRKIEKKRKNGR